MRRQRLRTVTSTKCIDCDQEKGFERVRCFRCYTCDKRNRSEKSRLQKKESRVTLPPPQKGNAKEYRKWTESIGVTYNWLTVERFVETRYGGTTYVECLCACGNRTIGPLPAIRRGDKMSCGCYGQAKLPEGKSVYHTYLYGAKQTGREFTLTLEQCQRLFRMNCYYCGIPPHRESRSHGSQYFYLYNGLDRHDNNKGYTLENAVPCCKDCNIAKHTRTAEDFTTWIERAYLHMQKSKEQKKAAA